MFFFCQIVLEINAEYCKNKLWQTVVIYKVSTLVIWAIQHAFYDIA